MKSVFEISKEFGLHPSTVSYILSGDRKTDNVELAKNLSARSGKPVGTFLKPVMIESVPSVEQVYVFETALKVKS